MPEQNTDPREQAQPVDPPCTTCDADGLFRMGMFTDRCGDCYGSKLTGQAFEDWLAAENAKREPRHTPMVAVDCPECVDEGDMFVCPRCGTDGAFMVPASEAPKMTPAEVRDVADLIAGSACDDASSAGVLSAVMQRRMNEAPDRGSQDRAGAGVLEVWALTASEGSGS